MLSYSQTVLIDNNGDTSVQITLQQMDRIYTELLQKDSLTEQSYINASNELLLLQILDSADKDIKLLKTSVNSLKQSNQDKDVKIRKSRNFGILGVCLAIVAILIN